MILLLPLHTGWELGKVFSFLEFGFDLTFGYNHSTTGQFVNVLAVFFLIKNLGIAVALVCDLIATIGNGFKLPKNLPQSRCCPCQPGESCQRFNGRIFDSDQDLL